MTDAPSRCRDCSRSGTSDCSDGTTPDMDCDAFLSWSELWARETTAIEQAQRITYATAAILVALAMAAVLFPKVLFN